MYLHWLQSQIHWQRPGFWLAISFAASAALLLAGSHIPRPYRYRLRVARWLLIPYTGLLAGGISPSSLGLSDIDWVSGLGLGVVLIFAILVLLVLIRTTLHWDVTDDQPSASSTEAGTQQPETAEPLMARLFNAGAQEFHWTFLRGALWEMLRGFPRPLDLPGYWAVWMASALALPGIFIQYQRTSQRLIATIVLVTTATLFFYTRNFWLCWLLHASVQLILRQQPSLRADDFTT